MSDMTIFNYTPLSYLASMKQRIHETPKKVRFTVTPLGQLYIISSLRENGYKVDFKDTQFLDFREKKDILQYFETHSSSSDIIGIGCVSRFLNPLFLLIKEFKEKHPEKKIILGGPAPTISSEEILKTSPGVDVVVKGEGEETIVELMNCLEKNKDLKNVRGISYRDGNRIRSNPARPRIENLDDIPFPAYDKLDIEKYDCFSIITSRGCPYRCTFCQIPVIWGGGAIFRSVDNVIEEIKSLYEKHGKKFLKIEDDTFPIGKKRVFEFCDKLKKEKIDFDWWRCSGRIDLMNDEIMKKMSESGCKGIYYGLESGSDRILNKIKKGFTTKQIEDVLVKSKKYFTVNGNLIWGFPFETMEDFKKTIRLAEKAFFELKINISLTILNPLVGTEIFNNHKDNLIPLSYFEKKYYEILEATELILGTRLFNNDIDISEIIREQPIGGMKQEFYRFKTPHLYQKIKIVESFMKKRDFYGKISTAHYLNPK